VLVYEATRAFGRETVGDEEDADPKSAAVTVGGKIC
jgi:hypothetical protein